MQGKIQSREIVRHAKKNGIKLTFGGVENHEGCARAVLSHMYTGSADNMYDKGLAEKVGLSLDDIQALEDGFECHTYRGLTNKRYYKVGENVRKLVGLSPKY